MRAALTLQQPRSIRAAPPDTAGSAIRLEESQGGREEGSGAGRGHGHGGGREGPLGTGKGGIWEGSAAGSVLCSGCTERGKAVLGRALLAHFVPSNPCLAFLELSMAVS